VGVREVFRGFSSHSGLMRQLTKKGKRETNYILDDNINYSLEKKLHSFHLSKINITCSASCTSTLPHIPHFTYSIECLLKR
jgi:hypothetical protein